MSAYVGRYDADPGEPVQIDDLPPEEGKWLLATVTEPLLGRTEKADLTLRRPQAPLGEPKPDVGSSSSTTASSAGVPSTLLSGSTRARVVAIAKSSLSTRTHFYRYSQPGALTTDPTPPSPARTDCSQWIRAVYLKAGAGDPGANTYAMQAKGRRTLTPRPGDLLIGPGHVELFVGGDLTIGHGSPPIDYGSVRYWKAKGFYFITYPFLDG